MGNLLSEETGQAGDSKEVVTNQDEQAKCVSCGGAGCSMCRLGEVDAVPIMFVAPTTPDAPTECISCGGAGCSTCRMAGEAMDAQMPARPSKCTRVFCSGGCGLSARTCCSLWSFFVICIATGTVLRMTGENRKGDFTKDDFTKGSCKITKSSTFTCAAQPGAAKFWAATFQNVTFSDGAGSMQCSDFETDWKIGDTKCQNRGRMIQEEQSLQCLRLEDDNSCYTQQALDSSTSQGNSMNNFSTAFFVGAFCWLLAHVIGILLQRFCGCTPDNCVGRLFFCFGPHPAPSNSPGDTIGHRGEATEV